MFDCVPCYGHDVYIDDNIVGYVERLGDGDAAITISGKDFARLTSDGKIVRNGEQVGDISMDGMIYFGDRLVGEVDAANNLLFYGEEL